MKKNILFIILFVFVFSTFSCIKEKFDSDLIAKDAHNDETVATPIGYVKAFLPEFFQSQIDSGILVQDENGMLWFRFNQNLFSLNVSDIIQFPEFDTIYSIYNNTGQAINLNLPGTQVQISQTFDLDFGYSQGQNSEEIDSILLNNMHMDVDVLASGALNANLNISFPGILYHNLNYSKDLTVSSSNSFADLMAYTIHLQNNGINKNQLQINFTLNMRQTARTIGIGEKIADINLNFSAIDFKIIFGYIGQINIPSSAVDETIIDLMNDKVNGYFNFNYGYFELLTKNSFGVPFAFNLDDFLFRTIYRPTGDIVFENSVLPAQTANISFPTMEQIGETITGTSQINTGAVQLAFQDYYCSMSGSISGISNPEGQKEYNFVMKESQLEMSTGFTVPFWGNTDNFHATDTINFALAGFFTQTYDNFERLLFIINFTNALPMEAQTQIYFCNAAGTKLDSMFTSPYTVSGSSSTDGNGKVSPEPNDPVKVEFLAGRLPNIAETSYLLVQSDIKTVHVKNSPPVSWKFFSDYYFYTQIAVAATLNQ